MTSIEKYPSAAKSELRSNLFWPASLCVVGAVVLVAHGIANYAVWQGWASFATAVALSVFAFGLYTLREWARWMVVAVAGIMLVGQLFVMAQNGIAGWYDGVRALFGFIFWGSVFMYFASPWTGRIFRVARSEWEPRAKRHLPPEADAANEPAATPGATPATATNEPTE